MRSRNWVSAAFSVFAFFLLVAVGRAGQGAALGYADLHNFSFGKTDGSSPVGGVVIDGSTIYGTTSLWGSGEDGVLYSANLDGTGYRVLHNFSGPDGNQPSADLVVSGTKVIGTAEFGGSSGAGYGTIFSYDTGGAGYQSVYQFTGPFTDAGTPEAGFTALGSFLYSATWEGGSGNGGSIIRLNSDGTGYAMIASIGATAQGGRSPEGNLVAVGSKLYGTTNTGGVYGDGTIFSFDPMTSTVTYLYSFGAKAGDGSQPHGNLAVVNNVLYGVTTKGGSATDGTLFSFNTTSSTYSLLHSFTGGTTDGADPLGGMTLVDSMLYGTASSGGSADDGIVYSFDPATTNYSIIHNFTDTTNDGSDPESDLTAFGNTIYGTTNGGGASIAGTLFSITVPEPGSLFALGLMCGIAAWTRPTRAAGRSGRR
jgi:uncharacterized repeat protein (TIGR03803 family)